MGTSTDAILFYGVHAGEDYWPPACDSQEEVGLVAACEDPIEWVRRVCALFNKENDDGIELEPGIHCTNSVPMPFISIQGYTAARGEAVHIVPALMAPLTSPRSPQARFANRALQRFVEMAGGEWSEPGWWLVSFWDTP